MGPIDVGRHWWPRAAGLPIVLAAVLCLIHDDWRTAVTGLILGGLITAAFVIATIGSPRARLAVVSGLLVLELGLYALSRPYGNAIAPPSSDWLGLWLVTAFVVCAVVLAVERIAQASQQRHTPAATLTFRPSAAWRLPTAVAALLLASCAIGCGYTLTISNDGTWRAVPTVAELTPLPSTLELVSADLCAGGGSSGNCTAEYVIAAKDAASPTLIVQRMVNQLRENGWPLTLQNTMYQGCRSVAGLRKYTDHCLWLQIDGSPFPEQPVWQPGEVVIYIDNS